MDLCDTLVSSRQRRCASFLRSRAHVVPVHRMQRLRPSGTSAGRPLQWRASDPPGPSLSRGCGIVSSKVIDGTESGPGSTPAPSIGTVACFNQARSARLAVAPRHVDDSPAFPRLQELKKVNVERAPSRGARDAIRHVVDFDFDPAIVDVLSLPDTARGHLDHLSSRDRADAFSAGAVWLERALGQLRMKRSLHPRAVPIEPSLDVVARRAFHRRFVAGCGFLGPDGIRLSASARRGYACVAHSVAARPPSRGLHHPKPGRVRESSQNIRPYTCLTRRCAGCVPPRTSSGPPDAGRSSFGEVRTRRKARVSAGARQVASQKRCKHSPGAVKGTRRPPSIVLSRT